MVRFGRAALIAPGLMGVFLATAHAQDGGLIYPPIMLGQGMMAVSTSAAINATNVTVATNSAPFPVAGSAFPHGYLQVKLEGNATANVAICWTGGTCTIPTSTPAATAGVLLLPGESATRNMINFPINAPTAVCATGTCVIELEW